MSDPLFFNDALCSEVDPEVFFPPRYVSANPAKAICAKCPVLADCREYAINSDERLYGVWGGMTERERRPARGRLMGRPEHRAPRGEGAA